MSRVLSRTPAARGLAALCLILLAPAARTQPATDGAEAPLDPASPLAPLPDLGLDWPDTSPIKATPDAVATPAKDPQPPTPAPPPSGIEQRYAVRLEGLGTIDVADFRSRFDAVSLLREGKGEAGNAAQIDRRAREDADTLRDLLRAEGYYDGTVTTRVEGGRGEAVVVLTIAAGPLYRFDAVTLPGLATTGDAAPALREAFAVKPDDAVVADRVTAAQAALRTALGKRGYVFATVGDPDIVVDHATRRATLTLAVDPGRVQRFGRFELQGRHLFGPRHLQIIARFRPGEPLDATLLDDFRRALIATGLVSTVTLTPKPTPDPSVANIAVRIERAPPRTVAGEVGYGTGEGARAAISWTHRNLISPEGAVTFSGVAGTQEQSLGAVLRRGNFRQRDQVLNAQVTASHIDRDAFDARTLTVAANIERQTNIIWQKTWTWSYGAELVASDEKDVSLATGLPRRRTFLIGALPVSLAYDGSDDLLNPTRGYRLSGRVSPELSLQGKAFGYTRIQLDGSAYLPATGRVVLAGRARLGSIAGAGRGNIAPSRRFYAGGGGSIRGYGYQDVGPRDADNDPVGGRSLTEFALEARVRFGDFGVVPFFDGGNLYRSELPKFTGFRYGAGLGVRYYSSFGPIRVDVGTPLNRQRGDPRVAVYVSLGQAF